MIKTQAQLAALLNSIYPTREFKWEGAQNAAEMPYIVYRREQSSNFAADNRAYVKRKSYYTVWLYFPTDSFEPEERLEQAFDENEIFYNSEQDKASDLDLGEFSDEELFDTSGGDFYINTYNISL